MQGPPTLTRPSILHRHRREASKVHEENAEKQYQDEKRKLAARAQVLQRHEERLIQSYYPSAESRLQQRIETESACREMARARELAARAAAEREEQWTSQPQRVTIDFDRPWSAKTPTYYLSKEEELAMRQRHSTRDAHVNRLLAAARAVDRAAVDSREQHEARRQLEAQEGWFNRGAAGEAWIPPQHRARARLRGGGPADAAQRPTARTPYYLDALESSAVARSEGGSERGSHVSRSSVPLAPGAGGGAARRSAESLRRRREAGEVRPPSSALTPRAARDSGANMAALLGGSGGGAAWGGPRERAAASCAAPPSPTGSVATTVTSTLTGYGELSRESRRDSRR